jgi:hypothetical protein
LDVHDATTLVRGAIPMTDEEAQMQIERQFDHDTGRAWKVACFAAAILVLWAGTAFATPPDASFALSTEAGESPASTTITWNCKGAAATAMSTGNQSAWNGVVALSGTKKLSGIRLPSMYGIRCDSAAGPSGFSVKWDMPQLINFDGSPLTDLLAWQVSYGTQAPGAWTATVRVPLPSARETFIEAPPGSYYVMVQAVATRGPGHESNVVQKTAEASQIESTTITKQIDVYTLPVAPVAQ